MQNGKFQIVCDNLVTDEQGRARVVEAMFSGLADLTRDENELLLRLHPVKAGFFDAVAAGEPLAVSSRDPATGQSQPVHLSRQIEIRVNKPQGGVLAVDYSPLAGRRPANLASEITVAGFDENAEPVIRVLKDGSLRLVFCTMPPRRHPAAQNFDMDDFGTKLQKEVRAELAWDDRDVFYVKSPDANTIGEITRFLQGYGVRSAATQGRAQDKPKGPWWKAW